MKRKYYFVWMSLLVVMSGCETVIDVDVPKEDPKLVVYAFITPHDTHLEVSVKQSNPLFSTTEFSSWQSMEDATVKISGPNGFVIVPFDNNEQLYSISSDSLEIVPGEQYRLDVSAPGFTSVFAVTRVPVEIPFFQSAQLEVREEIVDQGYSQQVFEFEFKWQDVSNAANFYEISIQQNNGEIEYRNFDDEGRNGDLISEGIQSLNGSTGIMAPPFHVYLLHTNEEYYLYKKSIRNISFGDPFAEPSQVYSNMVNGIGCFGAYTGTSVFITP